MKDQNQLDRSNLYSGNRRRGFAKGAAPYIVALGMTAAAFEGCDLSSPLLSGMHFLYLKNTSAIAGGTWTDYATVNEEGMKYDASSNFKPELDFNISNNGRISARIPSNTPNGSIIKVIEKAGSAIWKGSEIEREVDIKVINLDQFHRGVLRQ